jgi:hypothetical protein
MMADSAQAICGGFFLPPLDRDKRDEGEHCSEDRGCDRVGDLGGEL